MSVICDCLIYTGLGDSEHAIRAVNADERLRGFGFRKLDTETAGGGKVFCGEVWAGAFNHTMPRDLLDAIAKAPWTYPEETIVVVDAYDYDIPAYSTTVARIREIDDD